jgi:hypothetical protein
MPVGVRCNYGEEPRACVGLLALARGGRGRSLGSLITFPTTPRDPKGFNAALGHAAELRRQLRSAGLTQVYVSQASSAPGEYEFKLSGPVKELAKAKELIDGKL